MVIASENVNNTPNTFGHFKFKDKRDVTILKSNPNKATITRVNPYASHQLLTESKLPLDCRRSTGRFDS